jgi:hypothetical protein
VYEIKAGALDPPLEAQLTDKDGPIPLLGATVVMTIRQLDGRKVLVKTCTITDAANGWVRYQWVAGDTNTVGLYRLEFSITWPGRGPRVVPNDSWVDFKVLALA